MAFSDYKREFAGRPVRGYRPDRPWNPGRVAYRISAHTEGVGERSLADWLDALSGLGGSGPHALVVGKFENLQYPEWRRDGAPDAADVFIAARERLPELRALFLGDIIHYESEASWIQQSDLGPLLSAYPYLEHLGARGSINLRLRDVDHESLRTLILEGGGLPRQVIADIAEARLPRLRHLELWLGTEDYRGDSTIEDLAPLLCGGLFPRLRYLGLRNSTHTDEIARALLDAPVLDDLEELDLSLGSLSDEGAELLLQNPRLAKLARLTLYHHYLSPRAERRLHEEISGPVVLTQHGEYQYDEREQELRALEPEERYCAVTE
jgi:hypothetical protein